jgi:transient receptor potential cation channel subfamily M protein 2
VITHESPTLFHKIAGYLASLWNIFDVFLFSLFISAVVLRWLLPTSQFDWARMAYSLDLSMFFIRFMQVFFVDKTMGPKVIIIRGMVCRRLDWLI